MRTSMRSYDSLLEKKVFTADNVELGSVDDVFVDKKTGEATWAAINTGNGIQYIPLRDAEVASDGVVVSYDSQTINNAPDIDITQGPSYEDTQTLIAYYDNPGKQEEQSVVAGDTLEQRDDEPIAKEENTVAHDEREEMTVGLHREQVGVEKKTVSAGKVRLKKYIVENTVQVPVTLREERARLVVDTIDEPHAEDVSLDTFAEDAEEQEVVLSREVAVINKQVVRIGEARIETYDEDHDVTIPATVREERAELEEVR